ncbi:hypothetical protein [Deinococcus knuensis]|uniref:Uncharacterized protein n=1 Tax=Deinococcus knuensis TaxID=1837380 RepID=A0ABQ2SEG6_9DEIO|nr:hypothetical protein [Deinococcus knuensis]GGS14586.1 hypothetical protein GCM10008961_02310 [Deinococcus knuensis]
MTPDYLPNTFPGPKWARVVQAVTWAEYGLNEEGRITEKSVRGPVIVWGRDSGEGEDLPRLEAPTPSPLELETARLNMRPHFLAFVRAAHGKVRHSVRWKTGQSLRKKMYASCRIDYIYRFSGMSQEKIYYELSKIYNQASRIKRIRQEERSLGIGKNKERILYCIAEDYGLLHLAPREVLKIVNSIVNSARCGNLDINLPIVSNYNRPGVRQGRKLSILEIMRFCLYNFNAFQKIVQKLKFNTLSRTIVLRELIRAAFRAHLARRVRPVSRRSRLPRPLYARPRPPSCPLAPPVA